MNKHFLEFADNALLMEGVEPQQLQTMQFLTLSDQAQLGEVGQSD